MPINLSAIFGWRKDDGEFVSELLDELRACAIAVEHTPHGHVTAAKVKHQIELRVSPARMGECLSLLAGLAEAGARLIIDLNPKGTV